MVTAGDIQGQAPALTLNGKVSLVWAQGTDDPALDYSQAAQLYTSTFDGSAWSAPVTPTLQLLAPPLLQAQGALATQAGASSYFALPITVPPDLCDEVDPEAPNPDNFDEPQEPSLSPDPPDPAMDFVDQHTTVVVRPIDPNEKVGPQGFGTARWIDGEETLGYTVYFENVAAATAPAQQVAITDTLDSDLDWSSLVVTEVAFGDRVWPVVDGQGGAYMVVAIADYRPAVTKTWQVEIVAGLDYETGVLTFVLTTLDPETGELPEDPLAGFLPPNDETGRGEGRVSFSAAPDAGLAVGTQITNQAEIVFDVEAPIWTNLWLNTIGTPYVLMVKTAGEGTVLRTPWEDVYVPGEVITLTAVPDPGWVFTGWSGGATGTTTPLTLTIQADTAITATFEALTYTLTTGVVGEGTVTRDPDQASFTYGEVVTLTAVAAPGWTFTGWSGDASGTATPLTLTIQADTVITATFGATGGFTLNVAVDGGGSVAVVPTKTTFAAGEAVTLTATADPGWMFVGWGGDGTGVANPLHLIPCRAQFRRCHSTGGAIEQRAQENPTLREWWASADKEKSSS